MTLINGPNAGTTYTSGFTVPSGWAPKGVPAIVSVPVPKPKLEGNAGRAEDSLLGCTAGYEVQGVVGGRAPKS